ncbi:uncharacterized protein LOC132294054 [Cornus florida]|uniref:uncharacterized protein LOC132294054 n=1 Tax=Cornus florida TaxID=4283 RepID=UPI0028A1F813|nr:uncharacterized protein LOC132294054 [Cornus florida]
MEVEVMVPSPAGDFNFDSACTTPYMSAPSSPQRFGNFFYSAPTSPTSSSTFYRDFNNLYGGDNVTGGDCLSTIPFNWEEKPGIPKTKDAINTNEDVDFEFDFSGQLERTSLSADELFDGGKIRPLKPPPRLHGLGDSPRSPRSPRSPTGARLFREALSPRHKKKADFDPFAAAIEQTRKNEDQPPEQQQQRGRERTLNSSTSISRHKGTRSLSPFRVSDILFDQQQAPNSNNSSATTHTKTSSSSSSSSSSTSTSSWRDYRKWRLKDFLLFRSASEGRATSKDPLKKYALLKKGGVEDDVKNSSFRSTDSVGSVSSRRRGPVSAHEFHYKVNRAVSEEMRKKTFLPYKQGLLGCLGFNPTVHEISKGLGSVTRG